MYKAIVTVETKETYYEMEFTCIKRYTYTAETRDGVLSKIYVRHRNELHLTIEIEKED